jgi:hypothetical protein
MVEDVVAWLPHSPMLAFDIIPSYGGGILPWLLISFMRSPSFVLATEDDPFYTIFLFDLFHRHIKSFL